MKREYGMAICMCNKVASSTNKALSEKNRAICYINRKTHSAEKIKRKTDKHTNSFSILVCSHISFIFFRQFACFHWLRVDATFNNDWIFILVCLFHSGRRRSRPSDWVGFLTHFRSPNRETLILVSSSLRHVCHIDRIGPYLNRFESNDQLE